MSEKGGGPGRGRAQRQQGGQEQDGYWCHNQQRQPGDSQFCPAQWRAADQYLRVKWGQRDGAEELMASRLMDCQCTGSDPCSVMWGQDDVIAAAHGHWHEQSPRKNKQFLKGFQRSGEVHWVQHKTLEIWVSQATYPTGMTPDNIYGKEMLKIELRIWELIDMNPLDKQCDNSRESSDPYCPWWSKKVWQLFL